MTKEQGPFRNAMSKFDRGYTMVADKISCLSALCLIFIMLLAVVDIVSSKTINKSIPGAYEIIQMLSVPLVYCTMCYVQMTRGQMNIPIITDHLPPVFQKLLRILSNALGVVVSIFIAYQGYFYTMKLYQTVARTSGAVRILTWPFCMILVIGTVLIAFSYFLCVLRDIMGYYVPEELAPDNDAGAPEPERAATALKDQRGGDDA